MGYDLVNIINSTAYHVSGTVIYNGIVCSDDNYWIAPRSSWTASSRGVCLVKEITGEIKTGVGDQKIYATSYTSSGTSYSQFAVIQTGDSTFEVTRRVSGTEDVPPDDHVEPTENQK